MSGAAPHPATLSVGEIRGWLQANGTHARSRRAVGCTAAAARKPWAMGDRAPPNTCGAGVRFPASAARAKLVQLMKEHLSRRVVPGRALPAC